MEKEKLEVLWFDDNPNQSFIINAGFENIKITPAENLNEGLKLLSKGYLYDAFIFDVNYKRTNEDESSLIVHEVIDVVKKITNEKIPWFVLTAGDYEGIDYIKNMIVTTYWEKELGTKKFYSKLDKDDILFDDIKKTVKYLKTPEWQTKNKYSEVFEIFDIKNEFNALDNFEKKILMDLLIAIENIDSASIPDHLNNIRKFVAGGVMKTLTNMGVIPFSIDKLNAKSYHLGQSKFSESIPIHVQRAFHSIISTCQDGSHSEKEIVDEKISPQIDKLVREGNAPYLLSSLVFEVLNILIWLKDFMVSHNDKEQNLINFKKIEKV